MTFAQAAQMNNQRALAAMLADQIARDYRARELGLSSPLLDRVEGLPTLHGSVVEACELTDIAPTSDNLQDYHPEEDEADLDALNADYLATRL